MAPKEKEQAFEMLVQKRAKHSFPDNLLNPSAIEIITNIFDPNKHLNPWDAWHGNLDAKYLVIGQDWGNDCSAMLEN